MDTIVDKRSLIEQGLNNALDYITYRALTDELVANGKSTAPKVDDPDMANYVKLNRQRMKRMEKTIEIGEELKSLLSSLKKKYTLLMITEPWCGDAARHVPVLAKMAELTDNMDLKVVLRDANLDLMDQYLTDGGRSIPKMVVLNADTLEELDVWGPRPAAAQKMVMDYKDAPEPKQSFDDFKADLQRWYDADKSVSLQTEMIDRLKQWEAK